MTDQEIIEYVQNMDDFEFNSFWYQFCDLLMLNHKCSKDSIPIVKEATIDFIKDLKETNPIVFMDLKEIIELKVAA